MPAIPKAAVEPIKAPVATHADAVPAAEPPIAKLTAVAAAANPPQVAIVATAHAATNVAANAQCHHACPLGSI